MEDCVITGQVLPQDDKLGNQEPWGVRSCGLPRQPRFTVMAALPEFPPLEFREGCQGSGFGSRSVWDVGSCPFSSAKFILDGTSSLEQTLGLQSPGQEACRLPAGHARPGLLQESSVSTESRRESTRFTEISSGHCSQRAGVGSLSTAIAQSRKLGCL